MSWFSKDQALFDSIKMDQPQQRQWDKDVEALPWGHTYNQLCPQKAVGKQRKAVQRCHWTSLKPSTISRHFRGENHSEVDSSQITGSVVNPHKKKGKTQFMVLLISVLCEYSITSVSATKSTHHGDGGHLKSIYLRLAHSLLWQPCCARNCDSLCYG